MGLGKTLKEKRPVDRVVAECGKCGMEFFDSMKTPMKPIMAGNSIELEAEAHRSETGHDDLQVEIDKPVPKKTIDATITVNND